MNNDPIIPAYWLVSHPCPPWCHGRAHTSSDHPMDRVHDSAVRAVTFDTMQPSTGYGDYRAPELTLHLTQGYRETEPRVCVEFEGDTILYATLVEAEAVADALLALIAEAREGAL